jgi:hypothetical protein
MGKSLRGGRHASQRSRPKWREYQSSGEIEPPAGTYHGLLTLANRPFPFATEAAANRPIPGHSSELGSVVPGTAFAPVPLHPRFQPASADPNG